MKNYFDLFGELYNKYMNEYYELDVFKKYFINLTNNDIYYLDIIYSSEGITLSELAQKTNVSKSAITQNINRYIKLGYVYKTQNENDKRNYNLILTSTTKKYFDETTKEEQKIYQKCLSVLTKEEKKSLIEILSKINKNM